MYMYLHDLSGVLFLRSIHVLIPLWETPPMHAMRDHLLLVILFMNIFHQGGPIRICKFCFSLGPRNNIQFSHNIPQNHREHQQQCHFPKRPEVRFHISQWCCCLPNVHFHWMKGSNIRLHWMKDNGEIMWLDWNHIFSFHAPNTQFHIHGRKGFYHMSVKLWAWQTVKVIWACPV